MIKSIEKNKSFERKAFVKISFAYLFEKKLFRAFSFPSRKEKRSFRKDKRSLSLQEAFRQKTDQFWTFLER